MPFTVLTVISTSMVSPGRAQLKYPKRKLHVGLRLQAFVCKNIYAGLYSFCWRIAGSQCEPSKNLS